MIVMVTYTLTVALRRVNISIHFFFRNEAIGVIVTLILPSALATNNIGKENEVIRDEIYAISLHSRY